MTLSIQSSLILSPSTQPHKLTCPFCRRLARHVDGQRDLQEIASLLRLPVQVTLTLARQGVRQGWLQSPQSPQSATFSALCDELGLIFGTEARPLLERALNMARLTPASVTPAHVPDVLLALELQLGEETRDSIHDTLDTLRLAYST